MTELDGAVREKIERLVAGCRDQCRWFLRQDYCPTGPKEKRRVLEHIRRHGDRESFRAASRLMQWLSPGSSGPSAASYSK